MYEKDFNAVHPDSPAEARTKTAEDNELWREGAASGVAKELVRYKATGANQTSRANTPLLAK